MNGQRRQLLRTAASCSAAMALLASVPAVQAAEEITIQSFTALDTANAEWIAQNLTERLADKGITVQILFPEDGIASFPTGTVVAEKFQGASNSAAGKFHLEIVPTVLAKGDSASLSSTYSVATLNYGSLSDATSPEKGITQFSAVPLEYAKKGMIPFDSGVDYRPIPALLAGEADVSVGTKFKLATAVAATADDGDTVTINGIPLENQTIAQAVEIFTAWFASTNPWADPLQSFLSDPIECNSGTNAQSSCGFWTNEMASSYRDLGSWYEGRDVGRQPANFWEWRKMKV